MLSPSSIALGLYIAVLVAAGLSDLARYEIPNRLTLALVGAFALLVPGLPLAVLAGHVTAGLVVFAGAAMLFTLGVWGGGDAKLIAAAAVWIGWDELAAFLLLTAILGAMLALILLAARYLMRTRARSGRWYGRLLTDGESVPYGVAIAAAAILLVPRLPFETVLTG